MNSDGNYAYLMGSLLKQKVLPFLPHRDGIPAQRPTTLCNFSPTLFGVMSYFTHTSHVLFQGRDKLTKGPERVREGKEREGEDKKNT